MDAGTSRSTGPRLIPLILCLGFNALPHLHLTAKNASGKERSTYLHQRLAEAMHTL